MVKPDVSDDVKFARLRRFNLIMGFLHLVQGILMIVLSSGFSLPVYANYLGLDEASRLAVIREILKQKNNPLGPDGETIGQILVEAACQFLPSATVNDVLLGGGPP